MDGSTSPILVAVLLHRVSEQLSTSDGLIVLCPPSTVLNWIVRIIISIIILNQHLTGQTAVHLHHSGFYTSGYASLDTFRIAGLTIKNQAFEEGNPAETNTPMG